jgi:hypothetical protein
MHHDLATAKPGLSLESARVLLEQSGYEIKYRFGHVHATRQGQELHICLIADLATMEEQESFLASLKDALTRSLFKEDVRDARLSS